MATTRPEAGSNPPPAAAPAPVRRRRLFGVRFTTLKARTTAGIVIAGAVVAVAGMLLIGRAAMAVRDLERSQYASIATEARLRLERMASRDRNRLMDASFSDAIYESVAKGPALPDSMIRPAFAERFPAQYGDRYVAVFDLTGRRLYGWTADGVGEIEKFAATNALFRILDNREPAIGLLRAGDKLFWVGGAPILPTNYADANAPIRGYLVVAQPFNQAAVAPSGTDRSGRLELSPMDSPREPFRTRVDAGATRDSVRVTFALADVFAQQTTRAVLTTSRAEFRAAESTLWGLALAALIGSALLAAIGWFAARRWFLDPTTKLTTSLAPVHQGHVPALIPTIVSAKEWTNLTNAINRLIANGRSAQERFERITSAVSDAAFERDLVSGEWIATSRFRQLLRVGDPNTPPLVAFNDRLAPEDAAKLTQWLSASPPVPRAISMDVHFKEDQAAPSIRVEAAVAADRAGNLNRIVGRVADLAAERQAQEQVQAVTAEQDRDRRSQGRFLAGLSAVLPADPNGREVIKRYLDIIAAGLQGTLATQAEPFDLFNLLQELSGLGNGLDLRITPGVPDRVAGDRRILRTALQVLIGTTDRSGRATLRVDQPERQRPERIRISVEDRAAVAPGALTPIMQAVSTGSCDGTDLMLPWRAVHFLAASVGGEASVSASSEGTVRSITVPLAEVAPPPPPPVPVDDPALWGAGADATFNVMTPVPGHSYTPVPGATFTPVPGATFTPVPGAPSAPRTDAPVELVADATVTVVLNSAPMPVGRVLGDEFAAALARSEDRAVRAGRIAAAEIPARLTQLLGGIKSAEVRLVIDNAAAIEQFARALGATELARLCQDVADAAEHQYLDTAEDLGLALERAWKRLEAEFVALLPAAAPESPAIDPQTLEQLRASLGEDGLGTQLITLFLNQAPDRLDALERSAAAANTEEYRSVAADLKGLCDLVGATTLARLCDGPEGPADPAAFRTEWTRVRRVLDQLMSAPAGAH